RPGCWGRKRERIASPAASSRRPGNPVPVHANDDLPKDLLRKIVREDLQLSLEEFNAVVEREG
ncbi:MAG TPA: hypothetical protein PKK49_05590, partial [Flavobacteriales bacterium]|nr:hypothetical protein [Flavobacteriales bacterium]